MTKIGDTFLYFLILSCKYNLSRFDQKYIPQIVFNRNQKIKPLVNLKCVIILTINSTESAIMTFLELLQFTLPGNIGFKSSSRVS